MSSVRKIVIVSASLVLFATSATPANNSEQVVFSGQGFVMTLAGNTNATSTPFGFWIWCAAEAAPQGRGGYQLANACQGSMYFYGLSTAAQGVIGQVTEGPDGIYTMHVLEGTFAELKSGSLTPNFLCTLQNTNPDAGPVQVSCSFPDPSMGGGVGAALVNPVVRVTGP
jgi:hypothetical protein